MISSKEADDLSLDEIDLPNSQVGLGERDSGLIEQVNDEDCLEMQIQCWLQRLICSGFFEQKNESLIKNMMELTKKCEQPSQLLEEKVFPIMTALLFKNMSAYEQKGWKYLKGSSGIRGGEENSRIELRNINNISF